MSKKAVLASIKPKYCELIAARKKLFEIRKNRPKIDVPFKVYIYQTKGHWFYKILECLGLYQRKVIGEFICDRIDGFSVYENGTVCNWNYTELYKSCLKYSEIAEYIGTGKFGYAWHISELVIYDKPKELSEFGLKRPPQSWCYVEEINDVKEV